MCVYTQRDIYTYICVYMYIHTYAHIFIYMYVHNIIKAYNGKGTGMLTFSSCNHFQRRNHNSRGVTASASNFLILELQMINYYNLM